MDAATESFTCRDFLSAGYYLVLPTRRPQCVSSLLPDPLLTLSNCVGEVAPAGWVVDNPGYCLTEAQRLEEAAKIGIPAEFMPALTEWASAEMGSPHTCFESVLQARDFCTRFVRSKDIVLLGIGLHCSLYGFLNSQTEDEANAGYDIIDRLKRGRHMAPGGCLLGYELLGFDGMSFHSWLCHPLPEEAHEKFGVTPNPFGFLDSITEAMQVTRYAKETGAEQAMWAPWLVLQYAL